MILDDVPCCDLPFRGANPHRGFRPRRWHSHRPSRPRKLSLHRRESLPTYDLTSKESFAGEPFEGTSMLAYHRARWMDARVGRFVGMDSFKGMPEAPPTLHRYSYVANEPTDLTDATGLISPQALAVGTAVHTQLGQDWVAGKEETSLGGRVSDVSIRNLTQSGGYSRKSNWLMKLYFRVSSLARQDLAATDQHAIYEIKAIDEFGQGQLKLGYYLDILQALDPDSGWRAGRDNEYRPPSTIVFTNAIGQAYFIQVDPPGGGVITYVWTQYDEALKAVLQGIGAVGELGPDVSGLSAVSGGFL
ncbi:MAG: RHS repeat-associated core domain-containing protein [Polyangiaceae bacterium]